VPPTRGVPGWPTIIDIKLQATLLMGDGIIYGDPVLNVMTNQIIWANTPTLPTLESSNYNVNKSSGVIPIEGGSGRTFVSPSDTPLAVMSYQIYLTIDI
jgi:hypothetical protein